MEQAKIGKFIASCRKEIGYTQAKLAEQLGITDRAVSKWETGKSLPDASIMLELCEILKINVNELLTGEKIDMNNYQEMAEINLVELKKKEEKRAKLMLTLEIVIGIYGSIISLMLVAYGAYFLEKGEKAGVFGVVAGAITLFCIVFACLVIEQKAGYYKCNKCGETYDPTFKQILMCPHIGRTRYMKCPCCGQKSWSKKTVSK